MTNALLIIDMQNDFVRENGALSVKGGEKVARKIADFIRKNVEKLDRVLLTMDTHKKDNISFCKFWYDKDRNNIKPFTRITKEGIVNGDFGAYFFKKYLMEYVEDIESKGKELIAWPEHCVEMTNGWCNCDEIEDTLRECSDVLNNKIYTIFKGINPYTEFYSAFEAEHVIEWDNTTALLTPELDKLMKYDNVYVCGLAADYCVKESVRSMLKYSDNFKDKIIVMEDCTAAIKEMDMNTDEVYSQVKHLKSTDIICG